MRLISVKDFADESGVTFEAIRYRIENGSIIPRYSKPYQIDADRYAYLIEYLKEKRKVNKEFGESNY